MTANPAVCSRALIACVMVAASVISGAAQRAPDGTGEISGTVITTSASPTPLARVLVTISSPSLTPSRTVITDDRGRFVFANLPEGRFTIVAQRPPYVKTAFGAKRPGRPGTPIDLTAGQRVTGVTMTLALGGVITGVIRNADGGLAPGVVVEATPLDALVGARILSFVTVASDRAGGGGVVTGGGTANDAGVLSAPVVTDDRGVYRIFGLPPGRYLVSANVTDRSITELTHPSDADMDEILARLQRRSAGVASTAGTTAPGGARGVGAGLDSSSAAATYGYAPIYYPGTPDPDQAVTLALAEGDERAGIDLDLQLVRTAAVEGRVSAATGAPPPATQVTLTRLGPREGAAHALTSSAIERQADTAGNFRFTGVLPGKYRIVARTAVAGVSWALAEVTIEGNDVSGLALTLQPGLRLSGRLAFSASTQAPPRDLTTIRLRLVDVNGAPGMATGTGRADGTFEIDGIVPGTYSVTSSSSDAAWSLRSVVVDGRDILDVPLEVGSGGDVTGAVATFSDQHTELSGTLQSAAHVPAPDYFVVVFSPDRAFWRSASRRVQSTRPSTDGHFTLRNLPAGDYLIAALTDLEPSDLIDASFMERLIPAALPVHLNDGEKKTQDLRLVK